MKEEHLSSSQTQRDIEKMIVEDLALRHGCAFEKKVKCFEFDFFNEEESIIGEVYCGIDSISAGSKKKVITDCFKLVAAEKLFGGVWEKYIVFVDPKIKAYFEGNSWVSEAIKTFGIKLETVDLSEETLLKLREAKKRQQIGNVKKDAS